MGVNIYPIRMGYDYCYLVQEQGIIMIDGGTPRRMKSFKKSVGRLPIEPEKIKLMVLTHGHWDHIGCAKEIKEMTGAKIAIHGNEKEWLEKALKPMPPGVTRWGRILAKAITMILPLVHIPAAAVDLVIGDEGFPLAEYGISGRVIHTPGHTFGSVSVLLDTGDAFVGESVRVSPQYSRFLDFFFPSVHCTMSSIAATDVKRSSSMTGIVKNSWRNSGDKTSCRNREKSLLMPHKIQ